MTNTTLQTSTTSTQLQTSQFVQEGLEVIKSFHTGADGMFKGRISVYRKVDNKCANIYYDMSVVKWSSKEEALKDADNLEEIWKAKNPNIYSVCPIRSN